ncbi:lytic transglycosylase domain-containing protein [Intrasporangium sp. YIM S08009]|uniref:lytic transglycosylase domain-containing protein n=1 Tax=Intrasporangium zincisolvens TaxID=3080018 RepID=UPI002B0578D9|nr:lytic transglycosylase domain-containing protein [Intrasporangium sp. YIM S08009]
MDEARGRWPARAVSGPLLAASSLTAALRSRPRVTLTLCAGLLALAALGGDPSAPTLPAGAPLSHGDRAEPAHPTGAAAAADAATVVAAFGRRAVPAVALLGTGLGSSPVDAVPASVTSLPPSAGPTGAASTGSTGSTGAASTAPGTIGAGTPLRVPAVLAAAYAAAARSARPSCHLPMTLLAGIGEVESGSVRGRGLTPGHVVVPAVLGPRLDGTRTAAVHDTDHGALDGDPVWDRAVGPMQFLPGTWRRWSRDGDGDGTRDPQDVEDAAASAAAYLCGSGRDLARPADLRAAVLSYNHSTAYLAAVLRLMARAEVPADAPAVPAIPAAGPTPPATRPRPTPPRTTVTVTATAPPGAPATVIVTVTSTVTASHSPSTTSTTSTTSATTTSAPRTSSAAGTPASSTGTSTSTSTGTSGTGTATSLTGTPLPTP